MLKDDLMERLNIVAPALSSVDLIPILTHLWFTGEHVLAYNDKIGISTPLKTEFAGAVPGKTMIDLLSVSRVKDVTLTEENDNLVIKAAQSRFKLPLLPPKSFVFDMPSPPKSDGKIAGSYKEIFLASIEHCMRSISTDTAAPEKLGLTVVVADRHIKFYSTTGQTLSYAGFDCKDAGKGGRFTLPEQFCAVLLDQTKGDDPTYSIWVASDHALVKTANATLFGRLVEFDGEPLNYERVLAANTKDMGDMIELPKRMKLIADRACIIAGKEGATQVSCAKGVLRFLTESANGEVVDTLKTDGHLDVSMRFVPRHIQKVCDDFDSFVVTSRGIVMSRSDSDRLFLIGNVSK